METCPRWLDPVRWQARIEAEAWNAEHPDERRELPAIVEPERVPYPWDDFDLDMLWLMFGG